MGEGSRKASLGAWAAQGEFSLISLLSVKAGLSLAVKFQVTHICSDFVRKTFFFFIAEEYLCSHKRKEYFIAFIKKRTVLEIKERTAGDAKWLGKP